MLLVAHHVARADGVTGINAWYYTHVGRRYGQKGPSAELPQVQLIAERHTVHPPFGNRLRSYLQIEAPNGTSENDYESAFVAFLGLVAAVNQFPVEARVGQVRLRCGIAEPSLAMEWQRELWVLLDALKAVKQSENARGGS